MTEPDHLQPHQAQDADDTQRQAQAFAEGLRRPRLGDDDLRKAAAEKLISFLCLA